MSSIAFKPEDAISARLERKIAEKAAKRDRLYKFVCPHCGLTEFGGPTFLYFNSRNKDGTPRVEKVPRFCTECSTSMVRYNIEKEGKKK